MAEVLFSKAQARLLGLLFGQPGRPFSLSELISLAGVGSGAVQREIKRLVESGLIESVEEGGRRCNRANEAAAIYPGLRGLVEKTVGIQALLRDALAPAAPGWGWRCSSARWPREVPGRLATSMCCSSPTN